MTNIDGQLEAFPLPVVGVSLLAYYVDGEGWTLTVAQRRDGSGWDTQVRYPRLVRGELVDLLVDAAIDVLELRG
jgi:hypothetical protein